MADATETPMNTDPGMPAPIAPTPVAPSAIQPNPAAQPNAATAAQPAAQSNAPDADTQAGASIPKNLVNNPQVPSQKLATQADLNKTSPAPHHSWLATAAEALAGGPQYTTHYDNDGNAVRTKVPVSLAHIGLALAAEVLQGGMAGGTKPAGQGMQSAQAGSQVVDKQREQQKQAAIQQDAQAKADQNHKLAVTEANMRIYQTAVNVGKASKETSQQFSDSFKPISDGIQDGTINLPDGVTKDQAFETDAMAGIKNGKTNITHDIMIPVGDPQPVIDPNTKQQKIVDGSPAWGHDYITVHNADKFQTSLTKDMQDKLHEIGMFQEGGKDAKIGEPQWSFADIMKKMSVYASVKAGEQLLQDHKNDAHDLLDRKAEDLDDMAGAVRKDPQMRKAVGLFAQVQMGTSGANSHIEDILNTMAQKDPQSASTLMRYLDLSPKDLDDMHNKRVEAATEAATKEPQAKPQTLEEAANKKADTLVKLSTVAKNTADVEKLHADTKKLLADSTNHDAIVDAMGSGRVAANNLSYLLRSKDGQALITDVTKKYPDFDSSKAGAYPKTYDEFTSTKKNTAGGALNAGATALKHLSELQDLNTNTSRIPGTKDYQAFQDKLDTLATELASFYGNSTIPGIQGYKDTLGAIANRDAAITTQAKSMGDKLNSYEHQWYNAAPSAVYQAPIPFIDHDALVARAKLDPDFAKRQPEGAKFQGRSSDGKTYWLNAAKKPIQEVVQGVQ